MLTTIACDNTLKLPVDASAYPVAVAFNLYVPGLSTLRSSKAATPFAFVILTNVGLSAAPEGALWIASVTETPDTGFPEALNALTDVAGTITVFTLAHDGCGFSVSKHGFGCETTTRLAPFVGKMPIARSLRSV